MISSALLFLDIGAPELMLILFVALLLFGGDKLPDLARGLGKGIRDFKDASEGVKREINNQIDNYESKKTPENKDTAVVAEAEPAAVTEHNHEEYRYEDGNFDDVHKPVANTIPASQGHAVATDQVDMPDYYAEKTGENHAANSHVSTEPDKTHEPYKS